MLNQTHQKKLIEYLKYLCSTRATSKKLGDTVKSVMFFIENTETIDRGGYQRFRHQFAAAMADTPQSNDCILDFLSFLGVGYHRKRRQVKTLEKKSIISKRNTRDINAFAEWLSKESDFSNNTQATYVKGISLFYQYADDFNTENVKRYLRTMEEQGKKASTINLRISGFEKFAQFASKKISIKRRKVQRALSVENVPTEKEYIALINYLRALPNRDYYFYARILATTGVRLHEFQKIRWEDIVNGETVLKGKGGKYRRVFFQHELQREVKAYVKEKNKQGVVLVNSHGQPMTSRGFDVLLKTFGDKAGIDKRKMHAHAFRHFFAKMYLKKNKDIVQLAELLGHRSIDTTKIYLQKSYNEQQRDFNRNVTW